MSYHGPEDYHVSSQPLPIESPDGEKRRGCEFSHSIAASTRETSVPTNIRWPRRHNCWHSHFPSDSDKGRVFLGEKQASPVLSGVCDVSTLRQRRPPLLSKSRFTAGLQCHKRLYLACFHNSLADPVTKQQQVLFDSGTEVGVLAQGLFPDGKLISEDYTNHSGAMASTQEALRASTPSPLYEAAFAHDGVRIRVDLLVPVERTRFDIMEVKSTSKVKEEHLYDVGIQWYVLRGSGIQIRHACVCHLNTTYVYQGGAYDLSRLFRIVDVTGECEALLSEVPSLLAGMRHALDSLEPPDVSPGRHCIRPYLCEFYGHCHAGQSEHPTTQLPRAGESLLSSLKEAGIEDIRDIPRSFPGLNALQRRVRDCVADNRFYLAPSLADQLRQLSRPVHFLDLEAFNPALPLYKGTRPYQVIPFQWSVHSLQEDGSLHHQEFLYEGDSTPQEPFAESLLAALGDSGPVLVYSSYEAARIRELAEALPALSDRLRALLGGRMVDMLELVRAHCYHPEFHGSFSIKSVVPALIPHLGYDDLAIADGTLASMAYAEMLRPETAQERKQEIRENLLAYCARDTLAVVELFRFFIS